MWGALGVLAVGGLGWWGATAYCRHLAGLRCQNAPYQARRAPAAVQEHARQLDADLRELQRLQPGLAGVDRKYLGQPLEETQSYLYTLAMLALRHKDEKRWALVSRLLAAMWVHEREASVVDLPGVQRLHLFRQRVLALYAQARLQRRRVTLPALAPGDWGGRVSLGQRLLANYRARQWPERGGPLTWSHAYDVLGRLDEWHRQLDSGTTLSLPTAELRPVYEALQGL